jgi:hypothetical protein
MMFKMMFKEMYRCGLHWIGPVMLSVAIAAGSRPLIIAYFSLLLATSVFNLYSRRSSEWLCK